MKLVVRLFPLGPRSQRLLDVLLREDVPRVVSARWPVAIEHPVLPTILREGDSAEGFWISGEALFSTQERQGLSHFEVVCRKCVKESPADNHANTAARDRASLMSAGGFSPIRLVSGFSLSRIGLKPNMVGSIGDWSQEYVLASGVVETLLNSGFSGFSLLPISHPTHATLHKGFAHLFSDSILKPAVIDCSIERIRSAYPEEHGQLRHLGCLTYRPSDLADSPDFCRTAEPWGGWDGWPSWVVRTQVTQTFAAHKLRGWAFRPVLVQGSALYDDYLHQWGRLNDLVRQCSRSTFDGGRW